MVIGRAALRLNGFLRCPSRGGFSPWPAAKLIVDVTHYHLDPSQ
jgi:hypothetical protein